MSRFPYKLIDLIDIGSTTKMFELLYEVAQIPNAVIDMEGNVLVGAGWQSICTDFHRKNPESAALCVESDILISEEIAAGKPHCIYECPLGLVDSSCPIIIDGHHLGNVFTGQMLHTPLTGEARDRFRAQAQQYGYNEAAYLKALEQVPVFPTEKHKEILKLLANIAEQLAHSGLDKFRVIEQSKQLEESEERYNLAAAATQDGIYDWNLVTNEIYYSPTWKRMLGYEDHELPNDFSIWEKLTKPEDVKASWKMQQEVINKQRDRFQLEFQMLHKDGHWVDIFSRAEAVFDDTGVAIRMVGTHLDITERKKAENTLLETTARHSTMIENIGDVIAIVGADGMTKYQSPNVEKWFGWKPEELLGNGWDKIHPDDIERIQKEFNKLLTIESASMVEYRFKCKDGNYKWIQLTAVNRINDPVINGALVNYHDITERKLVELELRHSEQKYKSLVEFSPDIILLADFKGFILESNNAVEYHLGYPLNDIVGKHFTKLSFLRARDFPKYIAILKSLARGETPAPFDAEVKHRDGSVRFLELYITILNIPDRTRQLQVIAHDITARKQAEDEIGQSEEKFRALMQQSPFVVELYNLDGLQVSVNKAYEELWDFPAETTVNTFNVLKSKEVEDSGLMEYVKRAYSGESVDVPEYKFDPTGDTEAKGPGRTRWLNTRIYPLKDKLDQVYNIVIVHQDVTERKQAEKKLSEAYTIINRSHATAILWKYGRGKAVFVTDNVERLTGYSSQEFLDGDVIYKNIIHQDDVDQAMSEILIARSEGQHSLMHEPYRIIKKDGEVIWVEDITYIRRDPEGEVTFHEGIIYDITERKQTQIERNQALIEAKRANEVKDQFIANISHEIRTPLNSILGFSDILRQRYLDLLPEKDQQIFQFITNSSNRLMSTVDSILNISQLEAGTVQANPVEMDLNLVTKQVVDQLTPKAEDKHLSIQLIKPKQPVLIFADQYCIQQAVLSLVDNAIKYTHEGHVKIELDNNDSQAKLIIKDTGIGISEEYQKLIFTPYTQESEGFTKNYQGVGLGLALTKRYLDLNDVELELVSQKNVGSTFTLIFPKYEEKS